MYSIFTHMYCLVYSSIHTRIQTSIGLCIFPYIRWLLRNVREILPITSSVFSDDSSGNFYFFFSQISYARNVNNRLRIYNMHVLCTQQIMLLSAVVGCRSIVYCITRGENEHAEALAECRRSIWIWSKHA